MTRAHEVWFPEPGPLGDWVEQAACRGTDRRLWFPPVGDRVTYVAAIAVCAECPVRQACLDYAVANRIKFGVWGGLNEHRRRALTGSTRRPRRLTPLHGTPGRYRHGCHCEECREAHRIEAARYRKALPS